MKRHSRVDILYRRTTLLPRWLCLERPFLLPFLYFLNSIPRSSRYYCITYIYISRIYACIPVDSLSEAWGGQKPKPVEYPLKHSEKKPVLSRSVVEVLGIFNSETFPLKISNHNLCFFFLLSISIRSVDKTNFWRKDIATNTSLDVGCITSVILSYYPQPAIFLLVYIS